MRTPPIQRVLVAGLVRAVAVSVGAVASRVGGIFAFRTDRIGSRIGVINDVLSDCISVRFNRVSRVLGVRLDIVGGFFLSRIVAGSECTKTDSNGQRG